MNFIDPTGKDAESMMYFLLAFFKNHITGRYEFHENNDGGGGLDYSYSEITGDYLFFEGNITIWYSENGTVLDKYVSVSGLPDKRSKKHQDEKFGTIPEGSYKINLSLDHNRKAQIIDGTYSLYSAYGIQQIPQEYPFYDLWGKMRARLEPMEGTNTFGRENFYFHDSNKGYTSGCIETESAFFDRLLGYQKSNSFIILIVVY